MNQTAGPGRPKTLNNLTAFNTKLQEDHKRNLEAILEVGPYSSYRELLESWTADFLKSNPEAAAKVKAYRDLMNN